MASAGVSPDDLPKCWSRQDKASSIEVNSNGLRLLYKGLYSPIIGIFTGKGQGRTDQDAAAVRANRPIPPAVGVYYFETLIICRGRDGYDKYTQEYLVPQLYWHWCVHRWGFVTEITWYCRQLMYAQL